MLYAVWMEQDLDDEIHLVELSQAPFHHGYLGPRPVCGSAIVGRIPDEVGFTANADDLPTGRHLCVRCRRMTVPLLAINQAEHQLLKVLQNGDAT